MKPPTCGRNPLPDHGRGYRAAPFTINRRMAAASAAVCARRHTIHGLTQVDVSEPRRLMRAHQQRTGETLSLTAYVVACVARAIAEQPELNSIRRGGRLFLLDDVTVATLIEREIEGEHVPEPVGIRRAQVKTFREIHDEIRAAQAQRNQPLGGLSGMTWVARLIPSFLFRTFIRIAARSVRMAMRYGTVSVTAVGMFGRPGHSLWLIPLSASTVAVTVGGITESKVGLSPPSGLPASRPIEGPPSAQWGGDPEIREHLCLTLSFDHDVVDGAPAARFTARLTELLESGDLLHESDPHHA